MPGSDGQPEDEPATNGPVSWNRPRETCGGGEVIVPSAPTIPLGGMSCRPAGTAMPARTFAQVNRPGLAGRSAFRRAGCTGGWTWLRIGKSITVAFRSAKVAFFRGAKGDYATVIDSLQEHIGEFHGVVFRCAVGERDGFPLPGLRVVPVVPSVNAGILAAGDDDHSLFQDHCSFPAPRVAGGQYAGWLLRGAAQNKVPAAQPMNSSLFTAPTMPIKIQAVEVLYAVPLHLDIRSGARYTTSSACLVPETGPRLPGWIAERAGAAFARRRILVVQLECRSGGVVGPGDVRTARGRSQIRRSRSGGVTRRALRYAGRV